MPKARRVELGVVVGDNGVGDAKPTDDVFPYEIINFGCSDCGERLGFDPLGEVVYSNNYEFDLALSLWHVSDEVESPLYKWPRANDW